MRHGLGQPDPERVGGSAGQTAAPQHRTGSRGGRIDQLLQLPLGGRHRERPRRELVIEGGAQTDSEILACPLGDLLGEGWRSRLG